MFSLRSVGESTKGEEVELHQVSFCPLQRVSYQQGEHDLDERVHIFECCFVNQVILVVRKCYGCEYSLTRSFSLNTAAGLDLRV